LSIPSPFGAAAQSIERAQDLVTAIRAQLAAAYADEAMSQLSAALDQAQSEVGKAAIIFEQQSRRLRELSSVVVGSTIRHF
jgi:hypothetical protein